MIYTVTINKMSQVFMEQISLKEPTVDFHLYRCHKLCDDIKSHRFTNSGRMNIFSRQMLNKVKNLNLCDLKTDEGRNKASRAAKSIGERALTELLIKHQDPHSVSSNLWTAVRARGCQFLGMSYSFFSK